MTIIKSWNGRAIRQREDGYWSATDMCQACGKLFADWSRLKSVKAYLTEASSDMGIPISHLVEAEKGNSAGYEQGTWVHRRVALRLSQWLSPAFAVQVDKWVEEFLTTGKIGLAVPDSSILPLSRDRQLQALTMLKDLHDIDPDDRTRVILKAHLINLVEASQADDSQPQLLSVTEICGLHGISIPSGKDSVLGRKVASIWRSQKQSDPQVCRKMLDTGHCAEIKVYPPEFYDRIVTIASEYQ